ncbi:hypothetical protein ACSTDC_28160, partial (plasmid) [Klebsiella pneumoniae]
NCGLVHPVTSVRESARILYPSKKPPEGGFFVFRARDYAQKKMISRRSFLRRIDIHGIYDVPCNESITGMHLSAEEIPLRYKMIMISN